MIDEMLNRVLKGKQRVTFTVTNHKGQLVKVILEGDGRCCKDIRDPIVMWSPLPVWTQGNLKREMMEAKFKINIGCPKCNVGLKGIEFTEDLPELVKCDMCCHEFKPTVFDCRVVPI
jgi:hypothetical protein